MGILVSEEKIFEVFPFISLWELISPGTWPIWTLGAWLTGFVYETTKHSYILNILPLGLIVSEKKTGLDPRVLIGRIYVGDH